MANTFFKFDRRALPNEHFFFMDTISYVHNKRPKIPLLDNSRFPFGVRVNPLTPRTRCGLPSP